MHARRFLLRGLACALLLITAFGLKAEGLNVDFYYSEGCLACIEYLDHTLPEIADATGIEISVQRHNLLDPETFEQFQDRVRELGVRIHDVPVLIIDRIILQGEDEVEGDLKRLFEEIRTRMDGGDDITEALAASAAARELPSSVTTDAEGRVLAVPVLAAGLLDGVNPCAFTTLIFMLAMLAVAGRSRREILILGLCFSVSVFVTYSLIGLGFFQLIRAFQGFPIVAKIIRWVLVAVLVVFAGLSIYDWRKIRAGHASEILLQLPSSLKRRIHGSIRAYARSAALLTSALLLGMFVSVFELACTGQIYFPTLTYLARVQADARSYALLLLYNVGFIVPLLAVFGLSYAGVSSQRIAGVFQRHLGAVKLGTAALFIALAVLTIVL